MASLKSISILKKISVMDDFDFRSKLDKIIKIFGKVSLERYSTEIIEYRSWEFRESGLPSLEYILSKPSLIAKNKELISAIMPNDKKTYISQDSFAYRAYYFKIIDKQPETVFSDDIFSSVKSKNSIERASKYSAYILTGNADKKFMRKMRSESSSFCSSYALRTLIENRELYEDNYLELISQFNDSKYPVVVRLLEFGSPSENLVGLLGNNLVDKNRVFKRINKLK